MKREWIEGFGVVGVACTNRNADEMDPALARIPALWAAFAASGLQGAGLARVEVPAGDYLVFGAEGEQPQALMRVCSGLAS